VFRILALLPFPVLRALFGFVAICVRVGGWRRKLIDQHLALCLAEQPLAARRRIARGFYGYLGELVAEVVHGERISGERLAERVVFENPEAVQSVLDGGQRVMILAAHHCNWEWLLLRCSVAFGEPLVAAYKPPGLKSGDRALQRMRSRFGATMVPAKQIVQHLLEQRGKARLLALVADQSPAASNEQQVWLPFLGQQTAFFRGPGWIAARMGYTVFLAAMRREREGHYAVRFVALTPEASGSRRDPDDVLRAYATALEAHVREHPAEYFWAYRRWKRSKRLYE
jgi:KDO2-lipid IV(A) lauroyltransferase